MGFPLRLEKLLAGSDYFGLKTLTPAQVAICRGVQGRDIGELWSDTTPYEEALLGKHEGYYFERNADDPLLEEFTRDRTVRGVVRNVFAGVKPEVGVLPYEICFVAAVRTFKSMLAAASAIVATQVVDLSPALDEGGEIPRYSILSLEVDNAKDVHRHIVAALQRPRLSHLRITEKEIKRSGDDKWHELLRESRSYLVGSNFIRHPSGRVVEIRVVAGKRAGGSLVSKWSIGCTLDEAPRMVGASEGVVNLDDARRAVLSRLLPYAQLLMTGSPWAPFGPVFEMVENDHGAPTQNRLVVRSTGPDLNPYWWTPDRCERIREIDPTTFKTDVLARFADAEQQLFPVELIESCVRKDDPDDIEYQPGHEYCAAMDPATRGNAWTFVIADRFEGMKRIVLAREWQGTALEPVSPRAVLREVATILFRYNLDYAYTDEWAADALRDLAHEEGMTLIDLPMRMAQQIRAYMGLAVEMADGKIELPDILNLKKDFKFVRKRPTQKGATIALLRTPDGRHADFAPSVMRALAPWLHDAEDQPPPIGSKARLDWEDERQAERELEQQVREMNREWWE